VKRIAQKGEARGASRVRTLSHPGTFSRIGKIWQWGEIEEGRTKGREHDIKETAVAGAIVGSWKASNLDKGGGN